MLVYLQNLPETRNLARNFSFPPSDSGAQLFQSKGCAECHTGKLALEGPSRNQTPHRHRRRDVGPPAEHEAASAAVLAGRDAPDHRLHLGPPALPRRRQRRPRQDASSPTSNCATCHNDPASGAPKLAQGQGRLFRHHHGRRPVGPRPAHAGPDDRRRSSSGRASPRPRCPI